jgi:hypothetical protein
MVEVFCWAVCGSSCDVIYVPSSTVNGRLPFVGLLFFDICGTLCHVLSRSALCASYVA